MNISVTHNNTNRKLSMRFFGAKQRKKDAQQQSKQPLASVREAAETRTDVIVKKDGQAADSGRRDLNNGQQQQFPSPKRRGIKSKSPTARPSSRSRGGDREAAGGGGIRSPGGPSPRQQRGINDSDHSRQSNRTATTTAAATKHRSSPKHTKKRDSFGSAASSKATAKTTNAKSPPSILHRNTHFGSPTNNAVYSQQLSPPAPPPPPTDISPLPMYAMSHNPRVRFMSSEQSVASTEASNVHLMAGTAGSVASSSAMSSSADRENVFDRVLNMVMAEEHGRLNAMGMSLSPDPKSDAAAHEARKEKFAKADAKAKAVVDSMVGDSASGSDDDLGLLPPNRMDLAPIDIDTGLEIGGSYDAPIDMDTGLEVHHKSPIDMDTGLEVEYSGDKNMNDDEVDEERWKRLNNEKGLTSEMEGLSMNKDRRCRSYEKTQPSQQGKHHNRGASSGSDPVNYQRSISGSAEAGAVSPPSLGGWGKRSPGRKGGKKTKKFWDKSKDLQSDEWVAFDKQGPKSNNNGKAAASPGRVSDLAAF